MSPIQQMFLGAGGSGADPVYIDDVFSIDLWQGTGGNITHTNGLDLSTEGGMVWVKSRSNSYAHVVTDTVRGTTKQLQTNNGNGELTSSNRVKAFNTNGFQTGSEELVGSNNATYAAWSWRKAEKWFDIQTWSGNLTAGRQISHNLKCVPGFILVKRNNGPSDWTVYHAGIGNKFATFFNDTDAAEEASTFWNNTTPTDSVITLGSHTKVNGGSGDDYIAYIFGGGESTAANATSIDFDASGQTSGDYLTIPDSDDWTLGNTFTIEFWFKIDSGAAWNVSAFYSVVSHAHSTSASNGFYAGARGAENHMQFYDHGSGTVINSAENSILAQGVWYHCALVNNGGTAQWYINGTPSLYSGNTVSYNMSTNVAQSLAIGSYGSTSAQYCMNGEISNLRIVKGTAVYTSAFRPPTEPLTNITNTKLLCCQGSSTTSSTVIPSGLSITANGTPTASVNSPFDDPAGFAFGADGDQNAIKLGTYNGNGSSTNGPEIYLGWEPSLIMFKDYLDSGQDWNMYDSMRGIFNDTAVEDQQLKISDLQSEGGGLDIDLSATGFKITSSHNSINSSTRKYIYVAFRSSDGGVGKVPEAGTDVFAIDTGNSTSSGPNFDSNFNVDFGLAREFAGTNHWRTSARLIGGTNLIANTTAARSTAPNNYVFDLSRGWAEGGLSSDYMSWMWKRHAGFDVVAYTGDGTAREINHSCGRAPEMIWVKRRNSTKAWAVYHKGLNGGSSPEDYRVKLDTNGAEASDAVLWNSTAPTSAHFSVGNSSFTNSNNDTYIGMLFASVDGISKVGSYTGDGTTDGSTEVTTGFATRFLLIKRADVAGDWQIFDTARGIDNRLLINEPDGQTSFDAVDLTATGFEFKSTDVNTSSAKYIYYAHA